MSTTHEMVAEQLNEMTSAVNEFKATQAARVDELRSEVDKLQTRLSRPGAFTMNEHGSEPRTLKSVDGHEFPLLGRGDKLAKRGAPEEFSLADFARSAIVGSRKAVGSGPALVPTGLSDQFIDDVRAQTVLVEAGTRTVVIDGPRVFARIDQDPTVIQHTENADDLTESDMLATPLTVNPKVLAAIVPLSEEVVSDSPNLDQILRTSLAGAFAQRLETLALAKLAADTNIPKSLVAQNPAVWLKVLEAVGASMALGNPLPLAMISSAADFIARASQLASTSGTWLGKPPALNAMGELPTSNLAAGTAYFGNFTRGLLIAARSEMRVEVVRWAKASRAQHALVAHARMDAYIVQPKALFKQLATVA